MPTDPHLVPGQHTLGPHVVGQRVVVRHLLPDGRASDVLGVCTAWGAHTVTIERDGVGSVLIALADVVTGKPVPPRASVRARVTAREVELHTHVLWPELVVEPLGEWMLRYAPPHDETLGRRTNSTLAMGTPGVPLAEAAASVRAWHHGRDREPRVMTIADSEVETGLLELGWTTLDGDAHCQLAPVSRALRSCNAVSGALVRRSNTAEEHRTLHCTEESDRLEVTIGDRTARGWAALDGDWLGVDGLHVEPTHRHQGLAHVVLAELLDWGASRGATTAWLHVEATDLGAIAFYDKLGFITHHTNRYLVLH